MFNQENNEQGFSLVELMVVVAIIGILAAVAVPQFNKFMLKAKQSEARANLGALHGSMNTFYSEWQAYCSDFGAIGFSVQGELRYNVGFTGGIACTGATVPGFKPPTAATPQYQADNTSVYCGAVTTCNYLGAAIPIAGDAINATSFTAVAIADLDPNDPGGANDTWTIDESKTMANTEVEF